MQGYIKVLMIMFKNAFLADAMPWIKNIAPSLIGYDAVIKHCGTMKNMFEQVIKEHQVIIDGHIDNSAIIMFQVFPG